MNWHELTKLQERSGQRQNDGGVREGVDYGDSLHPKMILEVEIL